MYHHERMGHQASMLGYELPEEKPANRKAQAATEPVSGTTEPRCFECGAKLSLVLQVQPCRCEQHFCKRHRQPELHSCRFDYAQFERTRLRNELQQASSTEAGVFERWRGCYRDHHAPRSPHALGHGVGTAMFLASCARGCLVGLVTWQLTSLMQHVIVGYLVAYLAAHAMPSLYEKHAGRRARPLMYGGCSSCAFSPSLLSDPVLACRAELENLKDLLLWYVITRRGTNCLAYLNSSRDCSVAGILTAVANAVKGHAPG